jgi:hypothetical protein
VASKIGANQWRHRGSARHGRGIKPAAARQRSAAAAGASRDQRSALLSANRVGINSLIARINGIARNVA